jgi:hypothetical protein
MITVYGDTSTTADDLKDIRAVRPENAGSRWKAIEHHDLVNVVKDEILTRGWGIEKELYTLGRGGQDFAGAIQLSKVKGFDMPDMALSLGFVNSNSRRKALKVTVGATVTCCLNGMCAGDIVMRRVHDHTVDLVAEVEAAVDQYEQTATSVPLVVDRLRSTELPQRTASEILMQAGRAKMVGWSAIGRVDAEYRDPTFGEHGKGTSWALLNAFTYAARPNINPTRQMEVFNQFREMLPTV